MTKKPKTKPKPPPFALSPLPEQISRLRATGDETSLRIAEALGSGEDPETTTTTTTTARTISASDLSRLLTRLRIEARETQQSHAEQVAHLEWKVKKAKREADEGWMAVVRYSKERYPDPPKVLKETRSEPVRWLGGEESNLREIYRLREERPVERSVEPLQPLSIEGERPREVENSYREVVRPVSRRGVREDSGYTTADTAPRETPEIQPLEIGRGVEGESPYARPVTRLERRYTCGEGTPDADSLYGEVARPLTRRHVRASSDYTTLVDTRRRLSSVGSRDDGESIRDAEHRGLPRPTTRLHMRSSSEYDAAPFRIASSIGEGTSDAGSQYKGVGRPVRVKSNSSNFDSIRQQWLAREKSIEASQRMELPRPATRLQRRSNSNYSTIDERLARSPPLSIANSEEGEIIQESGSSYREAPRPETRLHMRSSSDYSTSTERMPRSDESTDDGDTIRNIEPPYRELPRPTTRLRMREGSEYDAAPRAHPKLVEKQSDGDSMYREIPGATPPRYRSGSRTFSASNDSNATVVHHPQSLSRRDEGYGSQEFDSPPAMVPRPLSIRHNTRESNDYTTTTTPAQLPTMNPVRRGDTDEDWNGMSVYRPATPAWYTNSSWQQMRASGEFDLRERIEIRERERRERETSDFRDGYRRQRASTNTRSDPARRSLPLKDPQSMDRIRSILDEIPVNSRQK